MSLYDILLVIDQYQYIKIQYRSDILYQGQRRYFIASAESHNNICVTNILVKEETDIEKMTCDNYYITICIDRGFD
jgi:hypothetical protein